MKHSTNLTQSQLLIWTGQQLTPESALYNMAFLFEYKGAISVPSFQAAFQALVEKSDILRTVFSIENDRPTQTILPTIEYQLEVLDWTANPEAITTLESWAEERCQLPFDLSKCLFDAALIQLSPTHFAFYLNQHHLITDAWAITILHQKLSKLYQAAQEGTLDAQTTLPPFGDYVELEKLSRTSSKKLKAREYWEEKANQAVAPALFYNRSNKSQTTRSERITIDLGAERTAQLRALAKAKEIRSWNVDASLFNIFMTALFAYYFRTTGQRKLSIGAPTHNRVKAVLRETLGLFIELFPLTIEIEEGETFSSLAQKVRTEANLFLRNAQPGLSTARLNRGFNCVLNFIHTTTGDFHNIPVDSKWIHPKNIDNGHHFRLNIHDFNNTGNIHASFDLNIEVFDEELRGKMTVHFLNLLDAFLTDRMQPIEAPVLITEVEQQELVEEFNQSEDIELEDLNIVQLFERQVTQTPDHTALSFEGKSISFTSLNEKANRIANYLIANNISFGKRVAIFLKRSPELIYSILGVLKSGATYIPIPSDTPSSRVNHLVEEGAVSTILTSAALQEKYNLNGAQVTLLDAELVEFEGKTTSSPSLEIPKNSLAYIMFTSGSTGRPKGVMIAHQALSNYIQWAKSKYVKKEAPAFPLFTMIGFDLTVTSTFLPLICGGKMVIYEEGTAGPDLSLMKVIEGNEVDVIKLTPSHLALLKEKDLTGSKISMMIVGGEDFKASLADEIYQKFEGRITIYNEYGPTEATVGCVAHAYTPEDKDRSSVPIGKPAHKMKAYVLDPTGKPVPKGVAGELYMAGVGLAVGYWNRDKLTVEKFVSNPFVPGTKMYQTGDLVRLNEENNLEYLGRIDKQIKVGGIRIEPGEIERALEDPPQIKTAVVELWQKKVVAKQEELRYCNNCGLPSNFPNVTFDNKGICNYCRSFETFQQKAQQYFKTMDDMRTIFAAAQSRKKGEYDCMMLLSGGKDSTYAMAKLVEMGYKVLAFTLDNGYISQQALDNIRRVADQIGVECIIGTTPAMNEIFVDSLERHCNVCNGCFKTIYTLSMKIALEKGIPLIVTGLSRGQFFETRLTEELFWKDEVDVEAIDNIILNARKEYHRVDDAVKRLLDVSVFEDDAVFDQVQFVDFYRYTDVSLDDMYKYLDKKVPWIRPTDTGRSTNCLINKLGIFVHTKDQGYSNYAFPYSWDVRMGHKDRATAIDEINEPIDEQEVRQMMEEIGYIDNGPQPGNRDELVAFYVSETVIPPNELRQLLSDSLPHYMIPSRFYRLDELPLTPNGKIDRKALPDFTALEAAPKTDYIAPSNQFEEMLAELWIEVLQLEKVGIHDNFIELGGNSLEAIRLMARISKTFELELPINLIFEKPTIAEFSVELEAMITRLLSEME